MAAERGGNCELTRPGETVVEHGVTILGPTNLPSDVPYHASQMFAKNITTFLAHLVKDGEFRIDTDDEITRDTLVATRQAGRQHGKSAKRWAWASCCRVRHSAADRAGMSGLRAASTPS